MFCVHCGKELADGSVFCKYCGKRLGGDAPPVQTAPPPVPNAPMPPAPPAWQPAPPPNTQPVYAVPGAVPMAGKPQSRKGGFVALGLALVALVGAVLFLLSRFGLFGGGGIVGQWVVTEVEYMGVSLSMEDFAAMAGQDFEIVFDFKKNGDVIASDGGMADIEGEGSYEVDGDKVSITMDGETQTLTLEDGQLVLEMDGARMVLEKDGASGADNAEDDEAEA